MAPDYNLFKYFILQLQAESKKERKKDVALKLWIWWHHKVQTRRLGNSKSKGNLRDWVFQRPPNYNKNT